jgi:hypothetical protein
MTRKFARAPAGVRLLAGGPGITEYTKRVSAGALKIRGMSDLKRFNAKSTLRERLLNYSVKVEKFSALPGARFQGPSLSSPQLDRWYGPAAYVTMATNVPRKSGRKPSFARRSTNAEEKAEESKEYV